MYCFTSAFKFCQDSSALPPVSIKSKFRQCEMNRLVSSSLSVRQLRTPIRGNTVVAVGIGFSPSILDFAEPNPRCQPNRCQTSLSTSSIYLLSCAILAEPQIRDVG